jgi:hypothetical protein
MLQRSQSHPIVEIVFLFSVTKGINQSQAVYSPHILMLRKVTIKRETSDQCTYLVGLQALRSGPQVNKLQLAKGNKI